MRMGEGDCMEKETIGTVMSVRRLVMLGLRLPFRDFICPHIIKVKYTAEGKNYIKRLWVGRDDPVPELGSSVKVIYCVQNPNMASFF